MGGFVVASDLGTGSCKTVVVDRQAKVVGSAQAEYPSYYPQPGWVEQDPDDWLRAVGTTIRAAIADAKISADKIDAWGVVGVTHNAVLLDKDGEALRSCILYLDTRSQPECDELYSTWGEEIFQRTLNSITPIWTWPQLLWIKKNQPEVWTNVDRILFQKDFVRNKIAPSLVSDLIDVQGSLLYDPVAEGWVADFVGSLDLGLDVFPQTVKTTDVVGHVDAQGAELSGLKAGTPVIAGTTDTAAEVFGAGSLKVGQGTVKLASVGRITCVTEEPLQNEHSLNYRHVLDGLWYSGTSTKYASSAFRWLRDAVWGSVSYQEMDKAAATISPGCDGLIFHPHLQGEWVPYWDNRLRGDFLGLTLRHGKPHLTRAVMEGVAFALRAGVEYAASMDLTFNVMSLIGRGSISNIWAQIIADTLNRPIRVPAERDAAYGTALITGMGIGLFPSDADELSDLVVYEKIREPSSASVAVYDELFHIYQDADKALKAISHRLNDFDEKYSLNLEVST